MSKSATVKYFNKSGNINDEYVVKYVIANDKNLTNETRKALGFSIEDMLFKTESCYFNFQLCSKLDFYSYIPSYGNCYSFNIGYSQVKWSQVFYEICKFKQTFIRVDVEFICRGSNCRSL